MFTAVNAWSAAAGLVFTRGGIDTATLRDVHAKTRNDKTDTGYRIAHPSWFGLPRAMEGYGNAAIVLLQRFTAKRRSLMA